MLSLTPISNLKNHIHDIVNRALLRSSFIFRCFISRNTANFLRAFKTYVRPLVEYVSTVWSPSEIALIDSLESVQRRFTKRLPGLSAMSYSDRLTNLNLQSLEHRRLINDLVMCYKIIHGLVDIDLSEFFTFSSNTTLRGHSFKLVVPIARTNVRKNFFTCRVVTVWNALPENVVSALNIMAFKKLIAQINFSKYLIHPCILLK